MQYSDYFVCFGLASIIMGILGFVRAKSRASLFAGGISGVLLVISGIMALRNPAVGYLTGAVVSFLLLGRFLPGFLRTKAFYPAGLMTMLSVLGVAAGIAGYLKR
jgi:uncharacterized membrane protein (UPF0136 family)